ncbi:MAG: peptidase M23 [Hirschia sp.]|nr:peptidase M23 [Hirschia sp.]MBF18252.1 peptidase M23 [Hirschia sp.]
MAYELKTRAKTLFEKVFPERQIYHRSGGSVRYVSVSPFQQAMFATGATLLAGWGAYATANVVLRGPTMNLQSDAAERKIARLERWLQMSRAKEAAALSLLEEKSRAFTEATNEFERRHATLKSLLNALKGDEAVEQHALHGNGGIVLASSTIEEADARQSRATSPITGRMEVAGFRAQIDQLRDEQNAFLDEAEDRAVERAERLRGVLSLTGVSMGRVMDQATATQLGGPLIEIGTDGAHSNAIDDDSGEFSTRVREVAARLDEARLFEELIHALPLGAPVGVEYRETSGYGKRRDPFTGRLAWHSGMDMGAFRNAPVVASAPGKVVFAGRKSGYGRAVEVDHGFGFITRYGHLASISVKKGDIVTLGEKVGGMGTTGRSTGVHLHYEVHFRGKTYDPQKFLRAGRHVYEG